MILFDLKYNLLRMKVAVEKYFLIWSATKFRLILFKHLFIFIFIFWWIKNI